MTLKQVTNKDELRVFYNEELLGLIEEVEKKITLAEAKRIHKILYPFTKSNKRDCIQDIRNFFRDSDRATIISNKLK